MKIFKKSIKKTSKMFFYNNANNIINKSTNTQIKKIFNIIYQYHVRNKRILFVNVPIFIIKNFVKIKKKIKHQFIPANIWINGLITNQSACFYSILKKKKNSNIKFLLKFKKKSDLIVNFNNEDKKIENLIKESYTNSIPSISFDVNAYLNTYKPTYSINNLISSQDKFFFYSILKAILKKKTDLKKSSYTFEKDFYTKKKIYKKKFTKKYIKKKFNKNNFNKNKHNFNKNKNNFNKNIINFVPKIF